MMTVGLCSYFNLESSVQLVAEAAVKKGYFLILSVLIVNQ